MVMVADVVATGNHYVLDVVGSALLLVASIAAARAWSRLAELRARTYGSEGVPRSMDGRTPQLQRRISHALESLWAGVMAVLERARDGERVHVGEDVANERNEFFYGDVDRPILLRHASGSAPCRDGGLVGVSQRPRSPRCRWW